MPIDIGAAKGHLVRVKIYSVSMQFKVGDKVRFLNEVGEGTIIEVLSSNAVMVENQDGFDYRYAISDLVMEVPKEDYKLDGIEHVESVNEKVQAESKSKKLDDFYKKFNHLDKINNEEHEIDLHIEELIDSHRGMSNSQILSVQMANFSRELNVAIRQGSKKLIAIHGVGEGVLRAEIRKEIHYNYPEFQTHDANYKNYGYGATEIVLKGA